MAEYICKQCGVQFSESAAPPPQCLICEDERQYINWNGQQWTTSQELQARHKNVVRAEGSQIYGIGTEPDVVVCCDIAEGSGARLGQERLQSLERGPLPVEADALGEFQIVVEFTG